MLTYNRTLPNISEVARKNWHILQINPEFRNAYVNKPTIVFQRNKNIQDLIGGHLIKDVKFAKKNLEKRQGKSKTCNTTKSALCCMKVVNTNTLKFNQTKRVFNIYHTITCKSQWKILLLEYVLCNLEYVRKSKTNFNIRLNNHWKDVSNRKAIPVCVHFRKKGDNFIQHAKFNRGTNQNGKC